MRRDCPKTKNGKADVGEKSTTNVAKAGEDSDGDVNSALVAADEIVDSWILDSSCSYHLCLHADWFHSYSSAIGVVSMGNNAPCKVVGIGTVKIRMFDEAIRVLGNVRHIPKMRQHLISLGYLEANGCKFKAGNGILKVCKGALISMRGTHLRGNIYKLEGSTVIGGAAVATPHAPTTDDTLLWHLRLGHMSETGMLKLQARGLLHGVRSCKLEFCKYCVKGKQCRVTFKTAKHDTEGVIDYIHADVWGPVDVMSKGGVHYFLSFVDDFSRKVWVYFLKHKSEVFSCFKTWCIRVENQAGRKIKVLRTDNGIEFKNSYFDQLCAERGIRRHFTVKKTPQQNGVAECMNRTIAERVRCLRLNSGLSKEFWAEAVQMVVYLVNRSPNAALDRKVAKEVWTGKSIDYSILRIF